MRGGLIDRRIGLSGGLDGRFEGAAALDAEGALIGMVLFGPRRRALVIPAETIDRVAPVLAEKGRVGRGYLGAGLHPVRDVGLHGAMVMSLDEDGPAKKAGLHLGDIITAWNGEAVHGPRDLIRKLGSDSVGKKVALTLLRGGGRGQGDADGRRTAGGLSRTRWRTDGFRSLLSRSPTARARRSLPSLSRRERAWPPTLAGELEPGANMAFDAVVSTEPVDDGTPHVILDDLSAGRDPTGNVFAVLPTSARTR